MSGEHCVSPLRALGSVDEHAAMNSVGIAIAMLVSAGLALL